MNIPEFTPEDYKRLKPEHALLEGRELADAMQDYLLSRAMGVGMEGMSFSMDELRFILNAIDRHLHLSRKFVDNPPAEVNGKPVTEEILTVGRRHIAIGISAHRKFLAMTDGLVSDDDKT